MAKLSTQDRERLAKALVEGGIRQVTHRRGKMLETHATISARPSAFASMATCASTASVVTRIALLASGPLSTC
jgi:hypothetical protein